MINIYNTKQNNNNIDIYIDIYIEYKPTNYQCFLHTDV